MKALLVLVAFCGLILTVGCSSAPQKDGETWIYGDGPSLEHKKKIWEACLKVLNEYGIVRESVFDEGLLVVTSNITSQFGENTRMVVSCKIYQDDEGYFEPVVRVMNQYDRSITHLYKVSEEQDPFQWTTGGFNPKLEVQIYNEIMDLVENQKNKFNDSFPESNPGKNPYKEQRQRQATPEARNV